MTDNNSDNTTAEDSTSADEMKEIRRQYPTGWLDFVDDEPMRLAVDALLDPPPETEFTTSDLAERAGLDDEDAERCVKRLWEMGFLEQSYTNSSRYRLNESGQVAEAIFTLNGAMIAARSEDAEPTPDNSESRR